VQLQALKALRRKSEEVSARSENDALSIWPVAVFNTVQAKPFEELRTNDLILNRPEQ
jgi:hypothetical protein